MKNVRNLLVASLTLLAAGCTLAPTDHDAAVKTIRLASKSGTEYGLTQWAKTNPADATEAATTLKKNINNAILPYFDGHVLYSSVEVSALLNSSLCDGVPTEVKMAITIASGILDMYLRAPDASTYLNADEVDYVKAFLSGVSDGCALFTSSLTTKVATKKVKWMLK